jgi:hypothetical protein
MVPGAAASKLLNLNAKPPLLCAPPPVTPSDFWAWEHGCDDNEGFNDAAQHLL